MIPTFPEFKFLSLTDKTELESMTAKFMPYSDYNFVSMWSYNVEEDFEITKLYDNIIVCFRDYTTNEKTLSFFGNTQVNDLCTTLLAYTKEKNILQELKFIPEFAITESIDKQIFSIQEDANNADYIYNVEDLATLPGSVYTKKRHKVVQFKTKYPTYQVKFLDLTSKMIKNEILYLFDTWATKKTIDTEHEKVAVTRLLHDSHNFELFSFGIYIREKLIGFTIGELVQENYAMLHYTKADHSYFGIFELIYTTFAQMLLKKGYMFINREQDMGLLNLRNAKLSWKPVFFLKKFTISYKHNLLKEK